MDTTQGRFLEMLRAALRQESVVWPAGSLSTAQWSQLFALAQVHHVLPLVFEAVYSCPALADCPDAPALKQQAVHTVLLQTVKTREFVALYDKLRAQGLRPLVVKGLVCRGLYPLPDHRLSADEDLLIPPEQFAACLQAMRDLGMDCGQTDAHEVPCTMPGSPLYIELHRSLFPPENDAYGDLNRFFTGVYSRAMTVSVDGTEVLTLPPTEHLLYLLLHAFKHFLHSGFGIRQVCDITLFARAYSARVDWQWLLDACTAVRAQLFAAAVFQIGLRHLGFEADGDWYPARWRAMAVDEMPLLEDLLEAGVYGGSSMDRRHSSTLTLGAVAAQKQGRRSRTGVLRSVFPRAEALKGSYPYLQAHPWLLPAAWVQRIGKYGRESRGKNAAASLALGRRRIGLLRQYGILAEDATHRRTKK